jgi:hypothetical protein
VLPVAEQVKDREAIPIDDDSLAIEHARAHAEILGRGADPRKARREIVAVAREQTPAGYLDAEGNRSIPSRQVCTASMSSGVKSMAILCRYDGRRVNGPSSEAGKLADCLAQLCLPTVQGVGDGNSSRVRSPFS